MDFAVDINGTATRWLFHDGNGQALTIPAKKRIDGIQAIAGVRLEAVSEFDLEVERGERFAKECMIRQYNALQNISLFLQQNCDDFTIELRFQRNANLDLIDCLLLFRILMVETTPERMSAIFEAVKRMLPENLKLGLMSANEIGQLLAEDDGEQNLFEVRRKVQLLPCGNFAGLHKTKAVIPRLNSIYVRTHESGAQETQLGLNPEWTYLAPVASHLPDQEKFNMYEVFRTMLRGRSRISVRLLMGATRVGTYDKAMASQFFDLVQSTYRRNTFLVNEEIDLYLKSFQTVMHQESLPVFQAFVSSSSAEDAEVAGLSLQSHFGPPFTLIKKTGQPAGTCQFDFGLFNENPGQWHEEASPFLERLQYWASADEIRLLFPIPVADSKKGLPLRTEAMSPFSPVVVRPYTGMRTIKLGVRYDSGKATEFEFPVSEIVKHCVVSGVSGSGKTGTIRLITDHLADNDVNFLLVEPVKGEGHETIAKDAERKGRKVHYFQVRRPYKDDGTPDESFLRMGLFAPYPGISVQEHCSYLHSAIVSANRMSGIAVGLLRDMLPAFYQQKQFWDPSLKRNRPGPGLEEWQLFDPAFSPSFNLEKQFEDGRVFTANNDRETLPLFTEFVKTYLKEHAAHFDAKLQNDLEGVLTRRLMLLTRGTIGHILCPELWRDKNDWSNIPNHLDVILNENCIIDLEGLPDNEAKALVMSFIFIYLYESRLLRKSHDPNNKVHCTIFEEAHRFLSASSVQRGGGEHGDQTPTAGTAFIDLFTQALAEFRSKGEGFLMVEQSVSKLVPDVVKLTNLKIMHRLSSQHEREYMGKTMDLDPLQIQYATHLKPGQAIVFSEEYPKAQLIQVHHKF